MITVFIILMLVIFGKTIGFAFKAAWGVTRIVFGLIFLPLILIGLVIAGFVHLALPILVIAGIVILFKRLTSATC